MAVKIYLLPMGKFGNQRDVSMKEIEWYVAKCLVICSFHIERDSFCFNITMFHPYDLSLCFVFRNMTPNRDETANPGQPMSLSKAMFASYAIFVRP